MSQAAYLVPFAIALVGLIGVVTSRHLVHMIGSLGVAQSSTVLLLLLVGHREPGEPPIVEDPAQVSSVVDPVVQALTLTDIVVGAVVTALLLALAIQAQKRFRTLDPHAIQAMRG